MLDRMTRRPSRLRGSASGIALAVFLIVGVGACDSQPTGSPIEPNMEVDRFGPAVQRALADPSLLRGTQRLAQLLDRLPPDQLDDVRLVFEAEGYALDELELDLFFHAWARIDPAAAVDHARTFSWETKRGPVLAAAIQGWALQDPQAAREVVDDLYNPRSPLSRPLYEGLVLGWASSGEPGLEAYVSGMDRAFKSGAGAQLVAARARHLGAQGLGPWADAFLADLEDDPDFAREVFRRVTKSLARRDPVTATAWADRHEETELGSAAVALVAEYGTARDPDHVFEWIESKETAGDDDGAKHAHAVRQGARRWLAADHDGMREFLTSHTLTSLHDPAVAEFAVSLVRARGAAAVPEGLEWAEKIGDPVMRNGALGAIAARWIRHDPKAAEIWLEQSPLGETARQKVRKTVGPKPGERQGPLRKPLRHHDPPEDR